MRKFLSIFAPNHDKKGTYRLVFAKTLYHKQWKKRNQCIIVCFTAFVLFLTDLKDVELVKNILLLRSLHEEETRLFE